MIWFSLPFIACKLHCIDLSQKSKTWCKKTLITNFYCYLSMTNLSVVLRIPMILLSHNATAIVRGTLCSLFKWSWSIKIWNKLLPLTKILKKLLSSASKCFCSKKLGKKFLQNHGTHFKLLKARLSQHMLYFYSWRNVKQETTKKIRKMCQLTFGNVVIYYPKYKNFLLTT